VQKVLRVETLSPPQIDARTKPSRRRFVDAGAEGSGGTEWLHVHFRRYGVAYVNQGEECAVLRLF
jgi:hypothetical protein